MNYKYNDNIELVQPAVQQGILAANEYYVLMVIDDRVADRGSKEPGDNRRFFDVQKGWLGLEQTSRGEIYISKKFATRLDMARGETWLARVADSSRCCCLAA